MLSSEELGILGTLDALVRKESVQPVLEEVATRLEAKLAAAPKDEVVVREAIPVSLFGEKLPPMIRSSWVFVLRAGTKSGGERHPNSHQRTLSLRGKGEFQVRENEEWESIVLTSDFRGPLQSRWASIPANVWHRAVVGDGNWAVVSFHTASREELILQRYDPSAPESLA